MERMRRTGHELTSRQREVLQLVAKGHTNGEIAELLGISVDGVKWHVSELLMRLDAESREELAEYWASETGLRGRLGRFAAALGGLVPLKAAAGLVGGLALLSGAGLGAAVLVAHATDGAVAAVATSVTPDPAVTPQANVSHSSDNEQWTPQEAKARAEAAAKNALGDSAPIWNGATPPSLSDLTPTAAEFLPSTEQFNASDGDNFWQGPAPIGLWHFQWQLTTPNLVSSGASPTTFEMVILLQDGSNAKPLAVLLERYREENSDWLALSSSNFQSRSHEEYERLHAQPSGPVTKVASLNNSSGGDSLSAYRTVSNDLCLQEMNDRSEWTSRARWTGNGPSPDPVEIVAYGSVGSDSKPYPQTRLTAFLSESVARIAVVTSAGQTLSFDAVTPPPDLTLSVKLVYVGFSPTLGTATVIAYAADGSELGRTTTAQFPPQP